MRTPKYQLEISDKRLNILMAHMITSINNYKKQLGLTEAGRLHHLENDALSLAFHVEKHELLLMMSRADMVDVDGKLVDNESPYEVRSGDTT